MLLVLHLVVEVRLLGSMEIIKLAAAAIIIVLTLTQAQCIRIQKQDTQWHPHSEEVQEAFTQAHGQVVLYYQQPLAELHICRQPCRETQCLGKMLTLFDYICRFFEK